VNHRVAIIQSSYIPWKGYFDLIRSVDEFIFYDTVQFTRRDWRTRNQIKTPQGLQWLSIPVQSKGHYHACICEILVYDSAWAREHWETLRHVYARAPAFHEVAELIHSWFMQAESMSRLSDINQFFVTQICQYLGIFTIIRDSSHYHANGERSEKLLQLCLQAGATTYISGPSAKCYLDENLFHKHQIDVKWFDYLAYPEYPQIHGPFCHAVSILDAIFHLGSETPHLIFRAEPHS